MIRKMEHPELFTVPDDTPFGCRLHAVREAYGLSGPFAQFWGQEGNGSVLGKLDDALVFEDIRPECSEWKEFIRMLDAKTMLCSERAAKELGKTPSARGEIMFRDNPETANLPNGAVLNPGVREIYALLCVCRTESFVPPEFEPFYMDLSYRIRHGTAVTVGIPDGDALSACAVCAAKTARSAVVSAVAAVPEKRRQGCARAAVEALVSQLSNRRIYIFRRDGENEEFYRALGFQSYGRWASIVS